MDEELRLKALDAWIPALVRIQRCMEREYLALQGGDELSAYLAKVETEKAQSSYLEMRKEYLRGVVLPRPETPSAKTSVV